MLLPPPPRDFPFLFLASDLARLSLSGNDIHASSLGLRRFNFLSDLDAVLIGPNRCSVCVARLVCDEFDFCLTNDNTGRV